MLSLAVYNSQLIAGGRFLSPGTRVASWNGSTWAAMGEIGAAVPDPALAVRAMTVFNGELYVGGLFCCVNGVGVTGNVARYDGTHWSVAVGIPNGVNALHVIDWNGEGPRVPVLYLGGNTGNGSSLRYTADGLSSTQFSGPLGDVYALTEAEGLGLPLGINLVVGGAFTSWQIGENVAPLNHIARVYDSGGGPSVAGMGSGTNGPVHSLRVYGEDLYVGGPFTQAGGLYTPGITYVDVSANSWAQAAGGLGPSGTAYVNAMHVFNNLLYVGGAFDSADNAPGVVAVQNLARWSGMYLGGIDAPPQVLAATVLGSRLIAGGDFSHVTPTSTPGASLNRHNLLTWDGVNNEGLGLGANAAVRALMSYMTSGPSASNVIVAGGDFSVVYGDGQNPAIPISAARVAQWTEPQLGFAGWSAMGAGFNGSVQALERFNGETVAGGAFTASGGTTIQRLARWTGAPPAWQAFGAVSMNGSVHALKTYFTNNFQDQHLVIGGAFTSAANSGVTANRIFQLTQTVLDGSWVGLGEGFNGTVYAVERYGNGLSARTYAAGAFTHTSSGGTQLNRIARFTGSPGTWQPVGAGVGFNGIVLALRSAGGFLYAAGVFTSVDNIACFNIARWNGSVWAPVDGGVQGEVDVLILFHNELIAGGNFASAKSPPLLSPAVARLLPSGVPWIVRQPSNLTRDFGQSAAFSVMEAPGYPGVSFQWRKNGTPLSDGATGFGSVVSGALTSTLTITSAAVADSGLYDCLLSNACGSSASATATLTVNATLDVEGAGTRRLALRVSPNPSRVATRLEFTLPSAGSVRVEVFDVQGRCVAVPLEATLAEGPHQVAWTGVLASGERAAGGMCLARVSFAGGSVIRRFAWLP